MAKSISDKILPSQKHWDKGMDHIQNRPMEERSIVARENVKPLSHAQNSLVSGVAVSAAALASPAHRRFINPEANVGVVRRWCRWYATLLISDLKVVVQLYIQVGPIVMPNGLTQVNWTTASARGWLWLGPGYTELSGVSDDDTSINLKVGAFELPENPPSWFSHSRRGVFSLAISP